jgi:hypothetical protein
MSAWTTSPADFWRRMMDAGDEAAEKSPASQAQKMLLSSGKLLHLMLAKMSDPASIEAALQGMETLPDVSMNMMQQSASSFVEMQKKLTEQASKIGKQTEAYKFEGIDENVFKMLKETYDKEIRKFFNVPALGLTWGDENLLEMAHNFRPGNVPRTLQIL